jgi:flagellar hook-basal body complex protein FliE
MLSGIGPNLTSILPELTSTLASPSTGTGQDSSFSDALKSAIQGVDNLQGSADLQVGNLLGGAPNTDVNHVMVSVEKADVAFQLMMQVRNKIVSAYQDIEKMQF